MGRTLVRDIRSVTVGTASTLLLPERTARLLTVVGSPPPPSSPTVNANLMLAARSIAATGQVAGFSPAAGTITRVVGWSVFSQNPASVLAFNLTASGAVATIDTITGSAFHPLGVSVVSPNSLAVVVTTAGTAGQTADVVVYMETFTAGPRISLGFGAAAVLDAGITIYAGQLPLILPGPALDTDIFGVADAAGRLVNVLDLFYP